MKNLRDGMSAEEKLRLSKKIAESLFMMPEFNGSKNLLVFVSVGSEVDTAPIIKEAVNRKMRVGVPRIDREYAEITGTEQKIMRFYEIKDFSELIPGYYGIPEPDEKHTVPFVPDEALMIVPGLAFDKKLFRIGYGGGFYDRYLTGKSDKKYIKCGVGFDFQLIDEIGETFDSDVPLDFVVSDERSFRKF